MKNEDRVLKNEEWPSFFISHYPFFILHFFAF